MNVWKRKINFFFFLQKNNTKYNFNITIDKQRNIKTTVRGVC